MNGSRQVPVLLCAAAASATALARPLQQALSRTTPREPGNSSQMISSEMRSSSLLADICALRDRLAHEGIHSIEEVFSAESLLMDLEAMLSDPFVEEEEVDQLRTGGIL